MQRRWQKSIIYLTALASSAEKGTWPSIPRYHNHLDSAILRTEWSPEEEEHLYKLHDEIGNKWAIIAQKLPGRYMIVIS